MHYLCAILNDCMHPASSNRLQHTLPLYITPQLNSSSPTCISPLTTSRQFYPSLQNLFSRSYLHFSSFPLRVKVVPAVTSPTLHNSGSRGQMIPLRPARRTQLYQINFIYYVAAQNMLEKYIPKCSLSKDHCTIDPAVNKMVSTEAQIKRLLSRRAVQLPHL